MTNSTIASNVSINTLNAMEAAVAELHGQMGELMQVAYECSRDKEDTTSIELKMEELACDIDHAELEIQAMEAELTYMEERKNEVDTSIDEHALAEYMAIDDDAPEGDDPHGQFMGVDQGELDEGYHAIYTITLVSVENPDDTRTEQVAAMDKKDALEKAFGNAPHWYTDVVSIEEAPGSVIEKAPQQPTTTEEKPMTSKRTDPYTIEEQRETFGNDYQMYVDWAYQANVNPASEEEYFGDDITVEKAPQQPIPTTEKEAPMATSINAANINKSQFISTISAMLFNNGSTPIDSMAIAAVLIENIENVSHANWKEIITEDLEDATATVGDVTYMPTLEAINGWFDCLVRAELLTAECQVGGKLVELCLQTEKSYPAYASHGVTRRFPMKPANKIKAASEPSLLGQAAIQIQQENEYYVDETMLKVAREVSNRDNGNDEQYVIDGCVELVKQGNTARVSEFKMDRRERTYQSDCHGPNGQSSDMARSLMDLSGVSTDYDATIARKVIMDEMADMCSDVETGIALVKQLGAVNFVREMTKRKKTHSALVQKPWSFLKAALLIVKLDRGEKPYIGMAFGLDAKCSGPQLGAILTGDMTIAMACGFGTTKALEDAYQLAMAICRQNGIHGLTRDLIKKAYMGIFYGQGAAAFSDVENYGDQPKQHDPRLLAILESVVCVPRDDESMLQAQAKLFHKSIEASFGKMQQLRKAMRAAHYHYEEHDGGQVLVMDTVKPTAHKMMDGGIISMDYRVKVDIMGSKIEFGSIVPDVTIKVDGYSETFKNKTFKTKEVSLYDHARSGFVNLIQGTDAVVAKHIIVEAKKAGCQHIIAVHDCFRVNINDFIAGKLHKAIEQAYLIMFSGEQQVDILAEYFRAVEEAGGNKANGAITTSLRKGKMKIGKFADVAGIITSLENKVTGKQGAYYFAK